MARTRGIVAVVLVAGLGGGLFAGCGVMSEEQRAKRVMVQQEQLEGYMATADRWGEEIIAQIPPAEIEDVGPVAGGLRKSSEYYEEWPKYYIWDTMVSLYSPGARTPTALADELDPWLASQGWKRNQNRELPPNDEFFRRHYSRESYSLMLQVYIEPPPRVQSVMFMIVTPSTNPDA